MANALVGSAEKWHEIRCAAMSDGVVMKIRGRKSTKRDDEENKFPLVVYGPTRQLVVKWFHYLLDSVDDWLNDAF